MTDADLAPDTRAIIQRRLIGLFVLLLLAFVLSLLLRVRPSASGAMPAVVIPLGTGTAATDPGLSANPVPVLGDAVEPQPVPIERPGAQANFGTAKPSPSVKPPEVAAKPKTPPEKALAAAKPKPPSVPPEKAKAPAAAIKPATAVRWFVAVGSYKDPMAAQAIANRVKLSGFSAGSAAVNSGAERLHRVRAGPFATKADAESARATLIVEGLTKASVVSEK